MDNNWDLMDHVINFNKVKIIVMNFHLKNKWNNKMKKNNIKRKNKKICVIIKKMIMQINNKNNNNLSKPLNSINPINPRQNAPYRTLYAPSLNNNRNYLTWVVCYPVCNKNLWIKMNNLFLLNNTINNTKTNSPNTLNSRTNYIN